jgi:hypothetical protein
MTKSDANQAPNEQAAHEGGIDVTPARPTHRQTVRTAGRDRHAASIYLSLHPGSCYTTVNV